MTTEPSSTGWRVWRRTKSLFTATSDTTAVPALALKNEILTFDNHNSGSPPPPWRLNEINLRASIKRKFHQVRPSLSFQRSPPADSDNSHQMRKTGHSRTQSDVQGTRGKLVHPRHTSTQSISFGLAAALPALTHVLEASTQEELSTPTPIPIPQSSDDDIPPPPLNEMDIAVPQLLQQGTPMTKVSAKKQRRAVFRLDPDQGQIIWESGSSKKKRIIPIENIKELRSAADARYYREQFHLAQEFEDRWLTLIYILDGQYKTLHLIAATQDVFRIWDVTLRKLYSIRQELMSGLGNIEMRQAVWEKQYWKGADEESDQKLDFHEVQRLCKRLNISSSQDNLLRLFKQADVNNDGYLDFPGFRRFVKSLKSRPELDQLYKKLVAAHGGPFDFAAFEKFMRDTQKSSLTQEELHQIFVRYASAASPTLLPTGLLDSVAPGEKSVAKSPSPPSAATPPTVKSSSDHHTPTPPSTTSPQPAKPSTSPPAPSSHASGSEHPPPTTSSQDPPPPAAASAPTVMTQAGFTAFLLSTDNSAFTDQHGKVWQDMTRPLSEYYISSSHNTYLVGHQLVGVSTIEGYIRALLHSCRSVELDIYDGDTEPMIFHGKTFTSKVSLREVCQAIAKYAFVASPYPVIISAEIHCGLPQQDMMAKIMNNVFGDVIVKAPMDGRPKIQALPSPEDLKGKVLLKAKNVYVSASEEMRYKDGATDHGYSSTETSTSDSDIITEIKSDVRKAREFDASDAVKELKNEFAKARNIMTRVSHSKSPSTSSFKSSPTPAPAPAPPTLAKSATTESDRPKVKMSLGIVDLLVYTVGVKCRGINKKEEYATEHVFSLSENTANKLLKQGMVDLIKHTRTHLVRIYPKGMRFTSSNYEPHRYWSAGAQLVAINWQTCDLGYMINHAMFQRNGRSGFILKPLPLRVPDKQQLSKRTNHQLKITIISAQQLPRPKDSSGREIVGKSILDPFVEVSLHVPDWTHSPFHPDAPAPKAAPQPLPPAATATSARMVSRKTSIVKNNGFSPVWQENFTLPFDCVGDMKDLIFVRFAVRQEDGDDSEPLGVYCASLGSLQHGYRHLPLHDTQMSQYLFSTLFVNISISDV